MFNKRGTVAKIENEWSLSVFYNLTEYANEMNNLENCRLEMETICNQTKGKEYEIEGCQIDIKILENLIIDRYYSNSGRYDRSNCSA